MSNEVAQKPDPRDIIQSFQKTIPTEKTHTCCLLRKTPKKTETKLIEEDIYEFYKKRLSTFADQDLKNFEDKQFCKCKRFAPYTTCVKEKRTIQGQRQHAIARENYLRTKWLMEHPIIDVKETVLKTEESVELEQPIESQNDVQLILASPTCSIDTFYLPSRQLIDLKKPKSGIFINPKKAKDKGLKLPFQDYNARLLQNNLDTGHSGVYTLNRDNDGKYVWMDDSIAKQNEKESCKESGLKECADFKPKYYEMPEGLHLSFGLSTNVIQGTSVVVPIDSLQDYRKPKEIACIFFAFSQIFVKSEEWGTDFIDYILDKGEELHQKSLALSFKDSAVDFDIIPEIAEVPCTLEFYLHFSGLLSGNPNLLKVVSLFFDRYNAAIFMCEDMYLLIWLQSHDTFKIFDPNGRTNDGCSSDKGKASLITTSPIEHVVHLILNLSSLSPMSTFMLYEIKLMHFGHIPNPMQASAPKKPRKLYQIVNKYFALVPGNLGILNPLTSEEVNSSLMVAFIAIAYVELDPPLYWTVNIIDNLIKYGNLRFRDFLFEKQINKCTITHLPKELIFGSYQADVIIKPFSYMGSISSFDSPKDSNMSSAITDFFKDNMAGILEIDASAFAIWKDSNFYYVLDPFKRGPICTANKDPNAAGVGYLQLHINLESLCKVMVNNAGNFLTKGKFYIHSIKINSVTVFNANKQLVLGNNFTDSLYIVYPFPCPFPPPKYVDCDVLQSKESLPQLECLSILSESPCERVCSESEFIALEKKAKRNQSILENLKKALSIQSIDQGVSYFSSEEVVDSLLSLILNDVMSELEERDKRKKHKSAKRKSGKRNDGTIIDGDFIVDYEEGQVDYAEGELGRWSVLVEELPSTVEADRILVHTDEGYLRELKQRFQRGELNDDACKEYLSYQIKEKSITMEEELKRKSNFISLPDGCWMLMSEEECDVSDGDFVIGVLAAISSIAFSSIFKISTWNSDVLAKISAQAYAALEILEKASKQKQCTVATILKLPFPKINYGERTYNIEISKKVDGDVAKLHGTLSYELQVTQRVLVIFNNFACAVFKRYNFYYLFVGFPSDLVGFRSVDRGNFCVTRHTDFDTMVKRIHFGRMETGDGDAFIICHIRSVDVSTSESPFFERSEYEENLAIEREMEDQQKLQKIKNEKLRLITIEIQKEKKRIENFNREKREIERQREERSYRKEKRREKRAERQRKREEQLQRLAEEKCRRQQEELEREEQEERDAIERKEQRRQRAEERAIKEEERKVRQAEELERRKNMPPEEIEIEEGGAEDDAAEGETAADEPAAEEPAAEERTAGGDDTNTGDEINQAEEAQDDEGAEEQDVVDEKEEAPKPQAEEQIEEDNDYDDDDDDDYDFEVQPKHVPGKSMSITHLQEFVTKPTVVGYRFTQPECLFKIQGSTALEDRSTSSSNQIQDCHLACIFATLAAVLKPLRLWDGSRIDDCIKNAKSLGKRIKNKTMTKERIIRNLIVDDYMFSVIVCISDIDIPKAKIDPHINRISRTRKYFIIQISNCSFAVYKDEFFHLFDPYRSLDKGVKEEGDEEEEEEPNEEEQNEEEEEPPCKEIPFKKHDDENTASWILFADIKDMLEYINKRASNEKWMEKFKLYVINIMKYSKASKDVRMAHALDKKSFTISEKRVIKEDILGLAPEVTEWLTASKQVPWSRLIGQNYAGIPRDSAYDREFDTEIPGKLWSLWGHIHPTNLMFGELRGKQYYAINVICICMINTFRFSEWNRQIIDNIVFHGDRYFKESIKDITKKQYEITLEDLELSYVMDHINFNIHLESVVYGRLYLKKKYELNLAASLGYFFSNFKDGVIQCNGRSFAFGSTNIGYYMFDCQAFGLPLFPHGQGSAYILRSATLQQLLKCMVLTFNLPYYNMDFVLHKVEVTVQKTQEERDETESKKEEEIEDKEQPQDKGEEEEEETVEPA